MPADQRYSCKVFADDVDETVRFNQYPQPPLPSWSSMFFSIRLLVRNVSADEERGTRGAAPADPPIRWYLQIRCTELCRDREEFNVHAVVEEARKIMCGILEECAGDAVPPFARKDIAKDFAHQACWMLCDARYGLCRKLPVTVELTVFSSAAALPMTSRLQLQATPRPATESVIEGLEQSELAPGSAGDDECAICLADLPAGSAVARLPCSHYFHRECVVRWLRTNCVCPLCRSVLRR